MKLIKTVKRAWIDSGIGTCGLALTAMILFMLPAKTAFAVAPKEADAAMVNEMPSIIADFEDGAVGAELHPAVPAGFGPAFRFYYLDTVRIETLNHEYDRAAIDSILEESEEWVYPLLDETGKVVSSVGFGKDGDRWGLWELPTYLNDEAIAFNTDRVAVKEYLAAQGIHGVREIKHIHSRQKGHSYIDMLYFEAEHEQYIIPFSLDFYDMKLENGKLYPASVVLNKLAMESAAVRVGLTVNPVEAVLFWAISIGTLSAIGIVILLRKRRSR